MGVVADLELKNGTENMNKVRIIWNHIPWQQIVSQLIWILDAVWIRLSWDYPGGHCFENIMFRCNAAAIYGTRLGYHTWNNTGMFSGQFCKTIMGHSSLQLYWKSEDFIKQQKANILLHFLNEHTVIWTVCGIEYFV